MAGNQINCNVEFPRNGALLKQGFQPVISKRIILWLIVACISVVFFFSFKRAADYYLSTMPQPVNTYSESEVFPVRGLHVTSWVAGSSSLLKPLVDLAGRTELNAFVIDLKEADGKVAYDSRLKLVAEVGARELRIENLDKVIETLRKNNIFPIARICVFKDPLLAGKLPHIAVKDKNGSVWRDKKGLSWVDPYCKQVWEYNTAIAEEAAQRGFKEIQFDYVRFPSDGIISNCVYSYKDSQDESAPIMAIRDFLRYARERLKPYNVSLSADVFGLTCSMGKELNIGQVIEEIAPVVDYICPMVYPSHYYPGQYNLTDPEAFPYKTVYTSLSDAQRRVGKVCRIRPWLQDFSLRIKYSANDVLEQKRAAYENNIQEWLLWNPACRYTASALGPKKKVNAVNTVTTVNTENTGESQE